jgi:hypothetical protein
VQDVYRLEGVNINDEHIEVIVRQMLRRVLIVEAAMPPTSSANMSSARGCWKKTIA